MATKQITVERFSVVSAKPFTEVVRAIEAQVGHPDIKQFYQDIHEAEDDQALQRVVNDAVGPRDLMEFISLDQRAYKIEARARERGVSVDAYLRVLIDEKGAESETSSGLKSHERFRLLREWASGHSANTPLLSDDAISRDCIYGVRG